MTLKITASIKTHISALMMLILSLGLCALNTCDSSSPSTVLSELVDQAQMVYDRRILSEEMI